tara:strand:+ start:656 stop:1414 length:759 start_codon:yes stop_codon:yes gene_type:complete
MSLFNDSRLSIDKLKANLDQGARANRFGVNITCPALNIKDFGIRCTDCQIPGRQLEVGDFSTYGPTVKYPYNLSHDGQEISFTFFCDSTFADRFIIDAWMSLIYSGNSSSLSAEEIAEQREEGQATVKGVGSSAHPTWSYYNDYIGQITIEQYTRSDKTALVHNLYEAYPISIAPMPLSSATNDEVMKFECTFAYRTWDSEYKKPNPVSGINRGRRILDALLGLKGLRKGGNKANDKLQRFSDRLAKLDGIF